MATRTASVTGVASDSATFGGSALSDGDIVVVNTGITLTFDDDYTLGSTASDVGTALTINATDATTFGKVVVQDGVTLTLRGTDKTTNRLALINRYGLFAPEPGATIVGDVGADYDSIIDNRGRFECVGTLAKNITLKGANPTWSNQITNEAQSVGENHRFASPNLVQVAKLARQWIANAAGTGVGSLGDSSISFSSLSDATNLQTEVATLAAVDAIGEYFVDYAAGVIYFYPADASTTFNVTYKYLSILGWGVESRQNTDYNTAIFDYCTFQYMGSLNGADEAAIRVRFKKSATAGANRLFKLTNCTVEYCKRFCGISSCDGTSGDKLQITGNTIRHASGAASFGDCFYLYRESSSHVHFADNNIANIDVVIRLQSFDTARGIADSWTITGNTITSCQTIIHGTAPIDDPAKGSALPDTVISDNTFEGIGGGHEGIGLQNLAGSSGHPCIVRNNTFGSMKRAGTLTPYMHYKANLVYAAPHHQFHGGNYDDGWIPGVRVENNILVGGTPDTLLIQLGYNTRLFYDGPVIANNTLIGGGIELGDRGDNVGPHIIMGAVIVNNLSIDPTLNPWPYSLQKVATDTSTWRARVQCAALDTNLSFTSGTDYNGITHQAIFARSGVRYNTDATRNVLGVMLWDSSAAAGPTNKSLVFTYTSATDQTLAWSGGTAVQLVISNGTATAGAAATLTNSGVTWTTSQSDANTPRGNWVRITGGTGAGQTRCIVNNTATVLTITPIWDTNPDATSTYTIIKSEAQLLDSGATDYVRAGIDARDLPTTSQTDTGIDVTYSEIFTDPLTSETGIYDNDPEHYRLGAGSPAIDAGADVAGVTTDYFGVTRDASPDIGAGEFVAGGGAPLYDAGTGGLSDLYSDD